MTDPRESGGRRQGSVRPKRAPVGLGGDATSEKDLPLKVAVRRLLWRMGCSTHLDVRLRGYVTDGGRGPGYQEFTDLDVLGVGFTPAGQLHITFADCRSAAGRVLERMFWVRGVADLVSADDAYIVRSQPVPVAARTLSTRLRIGVLAPEDLAAMETTFPSALDLTSGPLAALFDVGAAAAHLNAHVDADANLARLIAYLNFDYWVYEPYRNLTQVVAQLSRSVRTMDPAHPQHRTLFYDCAWHYALAVARAVAHVRSTRMGDVPTAVRTYAAGGELALREKVNLARYLRRAGFPDLDAGVVQPPYIDELVELITTFLVRPAELAYVLRYAEYLAVSETNRIHASVGEAFGEEISPIAAKLLADICGFLVAAAGLRPDFRTAARSRLIVDLTGGNLGEPIATDTEEAAQDRRDEPPQPLF
jgi:hypothetical protein